MEASEPGRADAAMIEAQPALPRHFRFRTVFVPILFMALHFVMINIVGTIYLLAYVILEGAYSQSDIFALLQDPVRLNKIMVEQYPVISVFVAAALIPVYWIYLTLNRRRDPRVLLDGRPRTMDVLPAIAMMIGALGVTNLWFNLLNLLRDYSQLIQSWMTDYLLKAGGFSTKVGYFWLILGICILTPITEELIFRGIIQGELRKAMPEWAAIIIQAVIFALFHMQPIQISYVLLPGLLLGMGYAWSKSIWVPIIMHGLFNFLGSVVPAWVGADETLGSIVSISEIAFILVGLLAGLYFWLNRRTARRTRS